MNPAILQIGVEHILAVAFQVNFDHQLFESDDEEDIGSESSDDEELPDLEEVDQEAAEEYIKLIQKVNVVRSVKYLEPLEVLCMKAALKNPSFHHSSSAFARLPAGVLTALVDFMIAQKNMGFQFKIPYKLIKNMMNQNLKKFDFRLIDSLPKDKQNALLKRLQVRCTHLATLLKDRDFSLGCFRLSALQVYTSTANLALKDIQHLSHLQHLCFINTKFKCGQIEDLATFFPKLKVLEMCVTSMNSCCLSSITKMTTLEQVSIYYNRESNAEEFYFQLWSTLLKNLPNLKVLSNHQLMSNNDPCLVSALNQVAKDHFQPLKLRRLYVNINDPKCSGLPAHLLPDITHLCVFAEDNSTMSLSDGFSRLQPLLKFTKVTNLSVINLSSELVMALVKVLGSNLKHLKVDVFQSTLDLYLLISYCPRVEVFLLRCVIDVMNLTSVKLKKGHFAYLKCFELQNVLEKVPSDIVQLVLNAENLHTFSCSFACNIKAGLTTAVANEGVLKELNTLCVKLNTEDIDEGLEEAIKTLFVVAPKLDTLRFLFSREVDFENFKKLKIRKFCRNFPEVRLQLLSTNIFMA